jgi:hypothetical protein
MSAEPEKIIAAENFDSSFLSLINGANKVLDTLASVWKYSLTALLVSLSVIGGISISLFLLVGREVLFTEGVIFLAIAAWIFVRTFTGNCNKCCNADIPRWKRVLTSFVQPNNTVISQQDGLSIVESLMRVIDESANWIRLIRRDVFSMLFWPVVAVAIFVFSVYSVDIVVVRVVEILFVIYVIVLTGAIYYSVKVKFQRWQEKVEHFKGNTATVIENL